MSENSQEFDFKTTVFNNTLIFKNFNTKRTGPLTSRKFHGQSQHSSQTLSWYYKVDPSSNVAGIFYIDIEVIADATSANKKQLHGEVETLFNHSYVPNVKTSGLITAGSRIGDVMRVDRQSVITYVSPNGIFNLCLTFSIHEQVPDEDPTAHPIQPVVPLPDAQLLDHLAELLENEKFSDFTVVAGKKEFPVHKAILAARSPVFAAMFEHEMQEAKQNRVIIEDVKPRVFQEVLRFIYTGIVKELDQMAGELLAAADKYALDRLRTICEDHLGSVLSVGTVTRTLHLADLHHADQLRQQAVNFISRNIKAIPTEDWQTIITGNPGLAAQMFAEMARLN